MNDYKINGMPWGEPIRTEDDDRRLNPPGIILWLDDVREMPYGYTHWAKTARQAIELLQTDEVIRCSLDHDLGNGCETGYDVAKFIEEQAHAGTLNHIHCRVHSQNPVGAENMRMALRSAYRAWGI